MAWARGQEGDSAVRQADFPALAHYTGRCLATFSGNRMSRRIFALIPAAGSGSRAGAALPKQYVLLNGQPLLSHTLRAFVDCVRVTAVHVVLAPGDDWPRSDGTAALLVRAGARLRFDRVGGSSRSESVINGLAVIANEADEDDWVLVHDAARPCITPALIATLIDALFDDPVGGLLALPVVDTVKRADVSGRVVATVPRDMLWLAQTPQMFRLGRLRAAYRAAGAATDEAGAIEAAGLAPRLVGGSARNIKVTYPADFALAERILAAGD